MLESIIDLTRRLSVTNLNQLNNAWQLKLDDNWHIAINGLPVDTDVSPRGSVAATIPPYHIAIWFNGWLAGMLHPIMGGVFANGTEANEQAFVEVVEGFGTT